MKIPATLRAGDTWSWTDTLSDYPASAWTLKYALRAFGLPVLNLTATADGDDHDVSAAVTETQDLEPGDYVWVAYVEKIGSSPVERYTVGEGTVTVKRNLIVATSTTDVRTHAEKMLALIEAALEAVPDASVVNLTVNGRTVQYKRENLLVMRDRYRREVATQRNADRIAQGLESSRIIRTRFS